MLSHVFSNRKKHSTDGGTLDGRKCIKNCCLCMFTHSTLNVHTVVVFMYQLLIPIPYSLAVVLAYRRKNYLNSSNKLQREPVILCKTPILVSAHGHIPGNGSSLHQWIPKIHEWSTLWRSVKTISCMHVHSLGLGKYTHWDWEERGAYTVYM